MNDADYFLSTDPGLVNVDTLLGLLKGTYWAADVTREKLETGLRHSLCFGIYGRATRELVGFARVVTDHATCSWICDVVVSPAHRAKGIGKQLMSAVTAHPAVRLTKSSLATRDAHGLYERYGYVRQEMMRRPPDPAV